MVLEEIQKDQQPPKSTQGQIIVACCLAVVSLLIIGFIMFQYTVSKGNSAAVDIAKAENLCESAGCENGREKVFEIIAVKEGSRSMAVWCLGVESIDRTSIRGTKGLKNVYVHLAGIRCKSFR